MYIYCVVITNYDEEDDDKYYPKKPKIFKTKELALKYIANEIFEEIKENNSDKINIEKIKNNFNKMEELRNKYFLMPEDSQCEYSFDWDIEEVEI